MKKIACLVLAIALMAIPVYAAVDIDLSAYSDDEIQELQILVQEEMDKRGLGGSVLFQPGTYEVGKDIRAGQYVFSAPANGETAGVTLLKSPVGLASLSMDSIITYGYAKEGEDYVLSVEDGQGLMIEDPVMVKLVDNPFAPDAE